MLTPLQLTGFFSLALIVTGTHHDLHHEGHDSQVVLEDRYHDGHSHGEQIPPGWVKYPWLSPQSYAGDNDGKLCATSSS